MGTVCPSGAHEFKHRFEWGSCYSLFSFMCMFCRSLFVFSEVRVTLSLVLCVCFVDRCLFFCTLAIVSVFLRFTDCDYPLSIFKLILLLEMSHCMFFN
jgi:hypothetical protein